MAPSSGERCSGEIAFVVVQHSPARILHLATPDEHLAHLVVMSESTQASKNRLIGPHRRAAAERGRSNIVAQVVQQELASGGIKPLIKSPGGEHDARGPLCNKSPPTHNPSSFRETIDGRRVHWRARRYW
jgi:hypothetical protein